VDWDRSDGWRRFQESRDSLIVIDASYSSELPDVQSRAPEMAPIYLAPGEPLKLHVFVNHSVVEIFANDRQALAARVYPGRAESVGVSLRAQGSDATLRRFDAWQMQNIYAETT
jgi:beta-fructofuranosidase